MITILEFCTQYLLLPVMKQMNQDNRQHRNALKLHH